MYAASAFNSGQITIDDLPDTILAGGVEPLNKNDPPISDPLPDGTPFLVYYGLSGEGVGILNSNSQWTNRQDFGTGISNECLVLDEQFAWYTDNFEDTYTVTTPFGVGTVARESLCVWRGTDNNGCDLTLFYGGGGFEFISEAANKWAVSFSSYLEEGGCETGYISIKDGFQNSPIGTHTDPVDTSVSATVS
jgi:hypothetical protein